MVHIMTEIKAKKLEIRKGVIRFCAVDNHKQKHGDPAYQIIYKAKTEHKLISFMIEKGIWE